MQRHDFLARLHETLKPKTYLEVGIQHGTSLNLAQNAEVAIGIDPHPQTQAHGNQVIFAVPSHVYFTQVSQDLRIDFAFIDGSHLFEDALQDFVNVRRHSHKGTVVVFDDMLPYSDAIAGRSETPGHWTGDVWKVYEILTQNCPELEVTLIDTAPTGTMVVQGLDQPSSVQRLDYDSVVARYMQVTKVPEYILQRTSSVDPEAFLVALQR